MTKRGEQVMRLFPSGEAHRRFLEALAATGLTLDELWLRYFALGGDAGKVEIEAYLDGMVPLSVLQHDLLAHAVNERLAEIAPPRAPYAEELPAPESADNDTESGRIDGTAAGAEDGDSRGPDVDDDAP